MPWSAAIGAASSLASNLLGNRSIERQNEASRAWALDMYNRQRKDNISDWEKQLEYNSPQEQMKRFQEAGLNPNLIYGRGNPGNTPLPSKTQVQSANFQPKSYEGLQVMDHFLDLETKKAQVDNLKAQNDVIIEDKWLKRTQQMLNRGSDSLNTSKKQLNDLELQRGKDTFIKDVDYARLRNKALKARINNDVANNRLLKEDLKLSKYGLSRGGNPIYNLLAKLLENSGRKNIK